MGDFTTPAGGQFSTAMGRLATAMEHGSFVYGDASTFSERVEAGANQFVVRAAGGTIFYSNSDLT